MYRPLEQQRVQFNELEKILGDPRQAWKLAPLCAALQATAQNIADTRSSGKLAHEDIAPLYRGFLAASRVLAHLREELVARQRR